MKDIRKQLAVILVGYAFALTYSAVTLRRADSDTLERDFDEDGVMTQGAQNTRRGDEYEKATEQEVAEARTLYEFLVAPVTSHGKQTTRYQELCDACNAADARRLRLTSIEQHLLKLPKAKVSRELLAALKNLKKPLVLPDTTLYWGGVADPSLADSVLSEQYVGLRLGRSSTNSVRLIMEDLPVKAANDTYYVADVKRLRTMKAEMQTVASWIEQEHARLDAFLGLLRGAGDEISSLVPVTGYQNNVTSGIDFCDSFSRDPCKIFKSTPRGLDAPYRHASDKTGFFPRTEDKPETMFWEDRTREATPYDKH